MPSISTTTSITVAVTTSVKMMRTMSKLFLMVVVVVVCDDDDMFQKRGVCTLTYGSSEAVMTFCISRSCTLLRQTLPHSAVISATQPNDASALTSVDHPASVFFMMPQQWQSTLLSLSVEEMKCGRTLVHIYVSHIGTTQFICLYLCPCFQQMLSLWHGPAKTAT